MDDFAPMEEFGLGTCVALGHARRLFSHLELFTSEGLIFAGTVYLQVPRGMIFLAGRRGEIAIRSWLLPLWRVAGFLSNDATTRAFLRRACVDDTAANLDLAQVGPNIHQSAV